MEPFQPEESPEWVPAMWTRGRFNRWFGRSPGRVVVWLIVMPCLLALLSAVLAQSGGSGWWVLAVVTVFAAGQSVIYLPRAWRAYRR